MSSIVEVSKNKITSRISIDVDDWTVRRAIIATNASRALPGGSLWIIPLLPNGPDLAKHICVSFRMRKRCDHMILPRNFGNNFTTECFAID